MRDIRHWTPRYIINRICFKLYQLKHPDAPWLTSEAITILSSWLKPSDIGLEWGSGRSTVWFAKRVHKLLSVEHDATWADFVTAELKRSDVQSKVDYQVISATHAEDGVLPDYVFIASSIDDESLDFCLIDGLYRDSCALSCLSKLKKGGLLIIDNVNWFLPSPMESPSPASRTLSEGPLNDKWMLFHDYVENWRNIWTSNGVTDTAFWVKT